MKTKQLKQYVTLTYITFWLMVLIICGGVSMVFHAPPLLMRILSNVCAWSPTIVLLAMWKRLRPSETRKSFLKRCFEGKIVWYLVPLLAVIVAGGVIGSVWVLSLFEHRALSSYFTLGGWSIGTSVVLSLLSGPTGEELGWRGYVREELAGRYSFTKAAVIQGMIWTFWHTVLWFVDSDFAGLELLIYIPANLIVMTCLAYMMNVILEKRNNLIYSVIIHFAFNLPYCFLKVDIWFYCVMSVIFVLIAAAFYLWRARTIRSDKIGIN